MQDEEDDAETISFDNIWSSEAFSAHLQKEFESSSLVTSPDIDIYKSMIWPQICSQIKGSALSVQDMVQNRKNSFEFYGYDFMVDENLKVWLIEVNSSPSMDSDKQPVLKELINSVLTDLAKVVVDYPKDQKADTGGFELVHRG